MIIAKTSRLHVRRILISDAPFILKLLNDPDYHANIGDRGLRTIEDAEDYCLFKLQRSYLEDGFGLYLVTIDGVDNQRVPIGFCGLVNREGLDGVDLGYALMPEYRGRGFASEACCAVMEHAFRDVGLEQLVAIVAKRNGASARVLEKLGFELAGEHVYPETKEVLDLYRCDLKALYLS